MFVLTMLNIMKQLWKVLNFYIPKPSHFPLSDYREASVLMKIFKNVITMQLYVIQL